MSHPLIAFTDKLTAHHISLVLQDNQLVLDPPYTLDLDEQILLNDWASALKALTHNKDVWLYWTPESFTAAIPSEPTQKAWDHILEHWLHDTPQQSPEVPWIRIQWWKRSELKRDAFAPHYTKTTPDNSTQNSD